MARIRHSIDYQSFKNSVVKVCASETCDTPRLHEAIDKAFNLACRNMRSGVSENYLFQEVLLYIRTGYDHLTHWC